MKISTEAAFGHFTGKIPSFGTTNGLRDMILGINPNNN